MYDFEVLGAGPTGSYAANALARRGFSVHLVDPAEFPRDKLCGGGLTRKALDLIRALEPSFDRTRLAEAVRDLYLFGPDGETVRTARLREGLVALVHRREFDAWWRERAVDAGAEFSHRPVGLDGARFLIAADGAGSAWGKAIRGSFPNDEVAVTTECHTTGPSSAFAAILLPPLGVSRGWGYSWLFGRSDGIVVGTGFRRDRSEDLLALRHRAVAAAHRFTTTDCSSFANWIIPLYRLRPAARGRVALVGDALGTADPLFAEGIASGMASAQVLVESFAHDHDFSGYPRALLRHPYFRAMPYFAFLQHLWGADPTTAFEALGSDRIFARLTRMLEEPLEARTLVREFELRHPRQAWSNWRSFPGPPRGPDPGERRVGPTLFS